MKVKVQPFFGWPRETRAQQLADQIHVSLHLGLLVRRAHAYVLLNARRHLAKSRGVSRSGAVHLDAASSARWFDGWRRRAASHMQNVGGESEVARPRTWLLGTGWRRHGLIDPSEVPGSG